jgi:hypothetical protein
VLNWFYQKNIIDPTIKFKYTCKAINNASAHKYIKILDWFLKMHKTNFLKLKVSDNTIIDAFLTNNYESLNWFKEKLDIYYVYHKDFVLQYDIHNKDICSICYDIIAGCESKVSERVVELQCRHKFHYDCIDLWNKNDCPYCRAYCPKKIIRPESI